MDYFKKWNLIFGWFTFAVSAIVYVLTMEPTASLWDCSEFIATSYKLEVGHPPGAPLFMMIARFFTLFSPSPEYAAWMVNFMSSICSAFCILFLFWSITHLARKMYADKREDLTRPQMWTVIGAGLIGALAYTFTDTFWFSAIEGEVYAMSSMFTAMVFWAILQWENVADQPHSTRWLILIAYLMGLSIGIHILNLLAIPAIVFVYYFRKTAKVTAWGVIKATLISGAIIVAINYIIIPYTVLIGAGVDRIFVNSMGLPVNSGLASFIVLLFALCIYGIYITHKKGKAVANTIILCVTVILLGYSSYASVVIRAAANPPMNSNDPSNPYSLFSLLNRDQYGNRPLAVGRYYSTPMTGVEMKDAWYLSDDGKYEKKQVIGEYQFPENSARLFPRMYSPREEHVKSYEAWGNVKGRPVEYFGEIYTEPTALENMRYFFSYQLNFMYWRYFLWNFVGRQSDIQGSGDLVDGNWLSGIKFIDALYLGPQDNIPSEMAANKGRNKYYFLPFLLGIIGIVFQLARDQRNFVVVMWLFFMMGIALVLYFNTAPSEPRERDYVYAGSFYAFCIWIGFGVMAVRELLAKLAKKDTVAIAWGATLICSCVPLILAAQNWDDHDRSGRYTARDIGYNYLESTLPNSIIMNYGDNDTFPLWYNQEVESVRTDVKVMNMSYLGADWYIDQMRIKSNEADAVPFSLPPSKYRTTNDYLYIREVVEGAVPLRDVMNFVKSENRNTKEVNVFGPSDFIPARTMILPVNKENAVASGIVKPEDAHLMEDSVIIRLNGNQIDRSDLMFLDLLDNFDWSRPLYFTQIYSLGSFGLRDYLQFDGFAYRLVPIRTPAVDFLSIGRMDVDYVYPRLMEQFRYGNINDPRVYADYFTQIVMNSAQARNGFARLSKELSRQGRNEEAVAVMDKGVELLPFSQLRNSYVQTIPVIEAYYMAGADEKALEVFDQYTRILEEYVLYYLRFNDRKAALVANDAQTKLSELHQLYLIAESFGEKERAETILRVLSTYDYY